MQYSIKIPHVGVYRFEFGIPNKHDFTSKKSFKTMTRAIFKTHNTYSSMITTQQTISDKTQKIGSVMFLASVVIHIPEEPKAIRCTQKEP